MKPDQIKGRVYVKPKTTIMRTEEEIQKRIQEIKEDKAKETDITERLCLVSELLGLLWVLENPSE